MEIRRIRPDDDLDRAGQIVVDAYVALDGYPGEEAYETMMRDVRARMDDVDVVVAVVDERIVGCLTFVGDPSSTHAEHGDADAASFRYFGVDGSMQGAGVGEAMVRWCIDEARRLGRRRLRIHTLTMMTAAQRLYQRLGFTRDGTHDEDWDGIVGLAYLLDL